MSFPRNINSKFGFELFIKQNKLFDFTRVGRLHSGQVWNRHMICLKQDVNEHQEFLQAMHDARLDLLNGMRRDRLLIVTKTPASLSKRPNVVAKTQTSMTTSELASVDPHIARNLVNQMFYMSCDTWRTTLPSQYATFPRSRNICLSTYDEACSTRSLKGWKYINIYLFLIRCTPPKNKCRTLSLDIFLMPWLLIDSRRDDHIKKRNDLKRKSNSI